jgi:hypothetical protein
MSDARSDDFDDYGPTPPASAGGEDTGAPREPRTGPAPDRARHLAGAPDPVLGGEQHVPGADSAAPRTGVGEPERPAPDPDAHMQAPSLINRDKFFPGAAAYRRREGLPRRAR